jgi:peptidoglycan/xylan/chitin deacetylase (PgdA/CDA1 family)
MNHPLPPLDRRAFLSAAGAMLAVGTRGAAPPRPGKARVAITLDLEMSRNFPTWEQTHWDYEKGNLNAPTKKYAVQAARRVKKQGGRLHFFVVGRVFEQESTAWLKELAQAGHPIGNHTYDHVNVKATRSGDLQFRFNRAPWLIEGKKPLDVIRENIRLTTAALKTRVGVAPAGFRTPGGFFNGLTDRPGVQMLLREQGYDWVSSKYPAHRMGPPGKKPTREVLDDIVRAQAEAQPFVYRRGLVEVPMSPPSDIVAFRTGRWKLDWFLEAVGRALDRVIATGGVFDFLGHPSCLYVVDPGFRTIELICDRVKKASDRAELVDLEAVARPLLSRRKGEANRG